MSTTDRDQTQPHARAPHVPPPVRRIVLDRPVTVVDPLAPAGIAGADTADLTLDLPVVPAGPERMRLEALRVEYAGKPAVKDVDLSIRQGEVLALIGPSGCGKTTLLRTLNRLTELTPTATRGGRILLDGTDVDDLEVTALRRRVAMVFQQPNPFPMSIFDNVAYALREQSRRKPGKTELMPLVVDALTRAGLYDEVADDLDRPALRLSGGQQQRLCIARALAIRPEILLMDEPASALDPIATQRIEELIYDLKRNYTIVIVTHNMQQAARVSDYTAFFWLGRLVEFERTDKMFTAPAEKLTEDYVTGRCG